MSSRLHGSDKNAQAITKRYAEHTFEDEDGEEYSATAFGDWQTYMKHKKIKLQNRNSLLRNLPEHREKPQIFRGVVATVNGYTNPSLQDLTQMIVTHGGVFVQYMDGKTAVTHIIASALTPKKMVEFTKYKVVKPAWVVECVKQGKLLPWENWRVIGEGSRQSRLGFSPSQPGHSQGALATQRPRRAVASYREYTSPGMTPGTTFKRTTSISSSRRGSIISNAGINRKSQTPSTVSSESSLADVPDGQSFAVVIPGKSPMLQKDEEDTIMVMPATQECIRVKSRAPPVPPPPSPGDESSAELFPSYQVPLPIPSSSPQDIPPSNQPEKPPAPEIPPSSPHLKSEEDEQYILSFTKSENDQVEGLMQAIGIGQNTNEFPLSQWTECENEKPELTPKGNAMRDEIPPTSPVEEIEIPDMVWEGDGDVTPTKVKSAVKGHVKQEASESVQTFSSSKKHPLDTRDQHDLASKKVKTVMENQSAPLLENPRIRNTTAMNPDFLKQYYQESRLHHLSTWKAELKERLQELTQTKKQLIPPVSEKVKGKRSRRYIMHVDFDCFFAAVSSRSHPSDLTGKPVCVTHGKSSDHSVSSDVASCNYKAREYGVKNGMWMKQVLELCPDIVCLPYNFPAYEEASTQFYSVLLDIGADIVQSVSVDEALVDVTSLCYNAGAGDIEAERAKADALATTVRDRVRALTHCDVSVGVGGNILLAKLALRKAKPAGQYQLKPEDVLNFLGPLRIQDLPGVGHSLATKLFEELQITKVADIRTTNRERFRNLVGSKTGDKLWSFAHGIDPAEVGAVVERKSVGVDVSWGVRFETQTQAEEFLHNLAGELRRRLVEKKVKGRQLSFKVMKRAADAPVVTPKFLGSGKCDSYTKSVALDTAAWDQEIIARQAVAILRSYRFPVEDLRGFGMQMTKLTKVKGGGEENSANVQRTLEFKPAVKQEREVSPLQVIKGETAAPAFMPPLPPLPARPQEPPKQSIPPSPSQFLVPAASQIDPSVLDALPPNMRASILAAAAARPSSEPTVAIKRPAPPASLLPSPPPQHSLAPPAAPQDLNYLVPSPSQIDPDFLASLTPSLREEILADYRAATAAQQNQALLNNRAVSISPSKKREVQSLLPQSPRKNHMGGIFAGGRLGSPSKRRKPAQQVPSRITERAERPESSGSGSGSGGEGPPPIHYGTEPRNLFPTPVAPTPHATIAVPTVTTIPQSSTTNPSTTTITRKPTGPQSKSNPPRSHNKLQLPSNLPPDLDPTVLAQLPPDILAEVLRDAARRAPGTTVHTNNDPIPKRLPPPPPNPLHPPASTRCLILPRSSRPPIKPRFQGLTNISDIRSLIEEWYTSTMSSIHPTSSQSGDGGPNDEDVDVLIQYLREVVLVERDLNKACGVVRWFGELVYGDEEARRGKERERGWREWRSAIEKVVEGVVGACMERGIPGVAFDFF
ncbi:hypothetical protein BDZ91DRAFT_778691 [Kalaharituber pfeilii]|nr:hypothetical protein BDZ91DRAFT_778691 [Kalaharituber pfeilii]